MDAIDVAYSGIARQAELVAAGEVSSRELVELCLERIERIDPKLNSFSTVLATSALAEADEADRRRAAGQRRPLLGVPVAIKDGVDVRGTITGHGTPCFEAPAAADATVVARLRDAGAVILGKTALPELAIYGFTESPGWGATRNPWRLDRTPGGSSGGSAAAVAAGLVGGASASDGAGSIRIPAANCALFGLKPQRGRVPLGPDLYVSDGEHWHGLSVEGCVTRTVADTALYLDAVAERTAGSGSFANAVRRRPERLRITCSTQAPRLFVPPQELAGENGEALERIAGVLGSLGHTVARRDPDFGWVGQEMTALYLAGIRNDVRRTPNRDRLDPRTRAIARLGAAYVGPLIRRARRRTAVHRERINRLFDDHDLLLTLVARTPAVAAGRWEGKGALRTVVGMSRVYPYNIVWNYLGNPAASIPAGFTAAGLPLAVQLVAAPDREDLLLAVAAELESELRWFERRPPVDADGSAARL